MESAFGVEHGEVSKALSFKAPSNIDKPFKTGLKGKLKNATSKNRRAGRQVYLQNQENARNYERYRKPFGSDSPFD